MILDDIKRKLEEIDPNVYYGMVDYSMREMIWDYIVFERKEMSFSVNKNGASNVYTVHIIRENFIPEGLERDVISKMLSLPGMRLVGQSGTYAYTAKPNTNTVVEMFSVDFVKPEVWC